MLLAVVIQAQGKCFKKISSIVAAERDWNRDF